MIVNMSNKEGVTLATQGKYCAENIEVVPTFEISEGNLLNEFLKGRKTDITAEDMAGITEIREYQFYGMPIKSIDIPNEVNFIGGYAFFKCKSLEGDIVISDNLTSLGAYAFSECTSLSSITIPSTNNITSIGGYACRGCGVKKATIGVTTTSVGMFASCANLASITILENILNINRITLENCTNLMEIICLAVTPPNLDSRALNGVPAECVIKVPAASVEAYKAAPNWIARADYITAIEEEE